MHWNFRRDIYFPVTHMVLNNRKLYSNHYPFCAVIYGRNKLEILLII
jgi:hypothetical protein